MFTKFSISMSSILIFMFIVGTEPKRDFEIVFSKCNVDYYNEMADANCTISKKNTLSGLTVYGKFSENIENVYASLQVQLIRPNGVRFLLYNNTMIDGCAALENHDIGNIITIILTAMRKYGNTPTKCPLVKDEVYYLKDLMPDPEKYPPYVPDAQFVGKVILMTKLNGKLTELVGGTLEGEVRRSKKD